MVKPPHVIQQDLENIQADIPLFIKTGIPKNIKSDKVRSIEERNNQAMQDILALLAALIGNPGGNIVGFRNPNIEPPDGDYGPGQLFELVNGTTYERISLWIYTGVNGIGWWRFPKQNETAEIFYGMSSSPQESDFEGIQIGDYYVQSSDGTADGDVLKILLFTNSSVGEKFIDPYGSKGDQGPVGIGFSGEKGDDGEKGEKGDDGESPVIGINGNWWVGNVDTGVLAGVGYIVLYDNDIVGLRNGINNEFITTTPFKPGTLEVYFNGLMMTKGNNNDFTEINVGTGRNGALLNRVVTTKDKLIFKFQPA